MKTAQVNARDRGECAWRTLRTTVDALSDFQFSDRGPLLRLYLLSSLPDHMRRTLSARANRIANRYVALISDGARDRSLRPVDAQIGAQMLKVTINALAGSSAWVRDIDRSQARSLYLTPLLFGALAC
jgi:hypothetical protein